jgi:glycosyltransferase involved in cell wall biosynthesis
MQTSILFLTKYGRKAASSRLRSFQFIPTLSGSGFDVTVSSLFDDDYIDNLYSGQRNFVKLPVYYFKRLLTVIGLYFGIRRYEVIFLEKELFPWMPWFFEFFLFKIRTPIIVDYDDAIFHRYDISTNWLVRYLLGSKIDRLMAKAHYVFAGSHYILARAVTAGSSNPILFPTVVDTQRYSIKHLPDQQRPVVVGWIGSPSTWLLYGEKLSQDLRAVIEANGAKFMVVGGIRPESVPDWMEFIDWSEDNEVNLIKQMDIGVMPLNDTPWARGKCGYKLIQYMACGIPVVASNVGENCYIVTDAVDGFLADAEKDFVEKVDTLIRKRALREKMGLAARNTIKNRYSLYKSIEIFRNTACYLANRKNLEEI